MSDQPMNISQQQALLGFDQAYETFSATFREVPDEALSFLPEGDDYALGVLLLHLQDPMRKYTALLKQIVDAHFAQIDLSIDKEREASDARRHAELVQRRPAPAERTPMLQELDSMHQEARSRFGAVDTETFERQAPVIYSAGTPPYPTSARDMLGWLTDHYYEHIPQTQTMLAQWKAQ